MRESDRNNFASMRNAYIHGYDRAPVFEASNTPSALRHIMEMGGKQVEVHVLDMDKQAKKWASELAEKTGTAGTSVTHVIKFSLELKQPKAR